MNDLQKDLDKKIAYRMKAEAEEMGMSLSEYMLFHIMHDIAELTARVGDIQRKLDEF